MIKKLFIFSIILVLSASGIELFAQKSYYTVPYTLRPYESLEQGEQKRAEISTDKFVKGRPLDPSVWKQKPGPARILNEEGGFELVNVSNAQAGQHENWIAIDPNNPDKLIATCNDSRGLTPNWGYRMVAFYTEDGGNTWTESTTPKNQGIWLDLNPERPWEMTIFDPGITFDTKGWAYYSYGFTETKDENGTNKNGVFICRSQDGGASWEEPVPVVLETSGSVIPFHDRYMITCDVQEGSPYKDNLYITWKRFIQNTGVLFSMSEDNGESWSPAVLLTGGGDPSQSATPVVGPDGEVYVVWEANQYHQGKTEAKLQKSTDGGLKWWANAKVVQTVKTIGAPFDGRTVLEDKQNIRVGSDPVIAVDCSDGPRRGWVYIVQCGVDDAGLYGLYMTSSPDGGDSWTKTKRIDSNPLRNDMFNASIAVDPINGNISLFYYSSQNDPNNVGVDGYLAFSTDGVNFNNVRLTPETWYLNSPSDVSYQGSANNIYWGDYTCITAYNGKIYPLFWMPSPLNGSFESLELFTVMLSTSPKAPTEFMAASDYQAPTEAVLTWKDPTQNILNGGLGEFKVIIYRDGNKIGEVDKGIQTYTDTGINDGTQYTYALRAKSSEGESTIVEAVVYAGGAPTPFAPENLSFVPDANGLTLSWTNPGTHVDGSFFHDFSAIKIYSGDNLIKTHTDGLQAGEAGSTSVEIETEKFHMLKISAVGLRGNIETESAFSNEIMVYSGAPMTEFSEDFEEPSNMVVSYTDGEWDITDAVAVSGQNCLTDSPEGDYLSRKSNIYFAPVVVGETNTTLSLNHIAMIDKSNTDYGVIAISTDNMASFTDLIWVDEETQGGFTNPVDNSQWKEIHLSLADRVGETLYIRLSVAANGFKEDDGWYIDDLMLDDNPNSIEDNVSVDIFSFNIHPNPVVNSAMMDMTLGIAGDATIAVYDNIGNLIMEIPARNYLPGRYSLPLDMSFAGNGVYYLRVTFSNMSKTLPFIINR